MAAIAADSCPAGICGALPGTTADSKSLRIPENSCVLPPESRPCKTLPTTMARRIEDYAVIGNCETMALVARDGSIDWLCVPRFDSPACFAALLGDSSHGRWLIAPCAAVKGVTRQYRGDTLILETVFETADGAVSIID